MRHIIVLILLCIALVFPICFAHTNDINQHIIFNKEIKAPAPTSIQVQFTQINLNKTYPAAEEKNGSERDVSNLIFFGDSIGYCPIIEWDSKYYVCGIFYGDDPIVCIDQEKYQALAFDSDMYKKLLKTKPKRIEDLIESGWAINLAYYGIFYHDLIEDDPIVRYLKNYFDIDRLTRTIDTKSVKGIKDMTFGRFENKPDAYLLILVRGEFFKTDLFGNCLDCDFKTLKLKSNIAYYPLVLPLFNK